MEHKIDLSGLSLDELTQLQRQIMEEKKTRDSIDKDSVCKGVFSKYHDLFLDEFREIGMTYTVPENYADAGREVICDYSDGHIFELKRMTLKMCDLALKNYEYKEGAKREVNETGGRALKIKCNSKVKVDPKLYKQMFDELFDIFCKYYNKREEKDA